MRTTLPDGANRVTTWGGVNPRSLALLQDGSIYFGREDGIFKYEGYQDNGNAYEMIYYSNPMNFGNSTNLKFLKKFNITIIGNVASPTTLVWGYDYTGDYTKKTFGTALENTPISEYGVSEFNIGKFTAGVDIQRPRINTSGSGTVVTIGIESSINGAPYSIQQIDVHALLGRLI